MTICEANASFMYEIGIAAGLELLTKQLRPTAILAANDDSAAGVMAAWGQLGLVVPRDVSICGFDDSWVARKRPAGIVGRVRGDLTCSQIAFDAAGIVQA